MGDKVTREIEKKTERGKAKETDTGIKRERERGRKRGREMVIEKKGDGTEIWGQEER